MMSKMYCGSFITDKKNYKIETLFIDHKSKKENHQIDFFNKLVGIYNFETKKDHVVRDHFTNNTKKTFNS